MALSNNELDAILAVRTTLAIITLIASTFLIISIILFQKYRFPGAKLVLALGITNGFGSIFYLLPTTETDNALCDAQAWGVTFNDWSTALWISIIAFNLWQTVIRKENSSVAKLGWLFIIIGWIFPIFMSSLPFADGVYEPTGGWCWLSIDSLGWRLSWYIPLFIFFILISVMYIWIVWTLYSQKKSDIYNRDDSEDLRKRWVAGVRLSKYPLIYILFWLPAIIHRLQNWITGKEDVFGLILFQVIFGTFQGTANALVYCWDEEIFHSCTLAGLKTACNNFKNLRSSDVQEYALDFEKDDDFEVEKKHEKIETKTEEDFQEISLEVTQEEE